MVSDVTTRAQIQEAKASIFVRPPTPRVVAGKQQETMVVLVALHVYCRELDGGAGVVQDVSKRFQLGCMFGQ